MTNPTPPTVDSDKRVRRQGPLVGTWLEDWHKVEGGWAATVCCEPGDYDSTKYVAALPAIASAFRVHRSMVTMIPDGEDETRCLLLIQRTSPINGDIAWPGPQSVDGIGGRALFATYADGTDVIYEIYRRGWGCPHALFCGSTGSGKSDSMNLTFVIDRWAHYLGDDGHPKGIVASFLIDPQQGQSFGPFLDDLAAPVATSLPEAMLMVEALRDEALRRNRYLAREATWWDDKRQITRVGRKWWDPLVDGPIITLTIDEAHAFLADSKFAALVTAAARMWRKCGMQIRLGTHTPLLSDLGNSMALRDMLSGGFVWIGRTNNGLTGALAFNGRLPIDPRSIDPSRPGTACILTPSEPKPMLARTCWLPDWYDAIRDDQDQPIGYPADLPPVTWAAFGPEFNNWVEWARADTGEPFIPQQAKPVEKPVDTTCATAILEVLRDAPEPVDADGLAARLAEAGHTNYTTSTVRHARADLKTAGMLEELPGKRWQLTAKAREEAGLRVMEGAAA